LYKSIGLSILNYAIATPADVLNSLLGN
jgi:hypothetical protein